MTNPTLDHNDGRPYLRRALGLPDHRGPFPWQERLLSMFRQGCVPRSLDLPTGLGKTSVMGIWLVARALGAPLPRRLVYVVDRRAVVDQASREAERLRGWLGNEPALARTLGLDGNRRLPISTLRGQFIDNREWLEDPSGSAIVVGTVDMVGSRLLFEGYGTSRRMRPYHAALLGHDALIVLDEAHLVPPFERLLEGFVAGQSTRVLGTAAAEDNVLPATRLVTLSATGRDHGGQTFELEDVDLRDPVVAQRVRATKRLNLTTPTEDLVPAVTEAVEALLRAATAPCRCLVYTDRRDDAEKVADILSGRPIGDGRPDVELLVGGRRVFDRTQAQARLQQLGFLAGSPAPSRHAVLVATSAGEVGVDLDADHMVCDLVAWERMVQRLGRVNRRGLGEASIKVLPAAPEDDTRAAYEARCRLIEALPTLGGSTDRDASPRALRELAARARTDGGLASIVVTASSPVPLHPPLERPAVEAWAMTSVAFHTGRPVVAPWLRGWTADEEPECRLVWRTHLPVHDGDDVVQENLDRYVEAAPPHLSEVLELETGRALKWLKDRAARLAKAPQDTGLTTLAAIILDEAGACERWATLPQLKDLTERDLHGRTIVVASALGGLKGGLLDAKHDEPATTADCDLGASWRLPVDGVDEPLVRFRVREVDDLQSAAPEDPDWRLREAIPLELNDAGETTSWLAIDKWRATADTEEERSESHPQSLREHQTWAEARAGAITRRLSLPSWLSRAVVLAAALHDEGKRSANWQRAFRAPRDADAPYAKTRGPLNVALLNGYRHEFGSLSRVEADDRFLTLPVEDRDLVLHLVAAHHGWARPFLSCEGCDDAPSVLEARAQEVALRFLRLQRRWGPWGLAYLETLVRAADQLASRDNDARETRSAQQCQESAV